jgi:hypothetical protein
MKYKTEILQKLKKSYQNYTLQPHSNIQNKELH